jgi:hypothetical protein
VSPYRHARVAPPFERPDDESNQELVDGPTLGALLAEAGVPVHQPRRPPTTHTAARAHALPLHSRPQLQLHPRARSPFDYDELGRWTRVGFERGTRSRNGER